MSKWEPTGLVSPLPIPENCTPSNVASVWMPVGHISPVSPPLDITGVPLVDTLEASTFVTQKRASEHASGRYALATLLREIGYNPADLRIVRNEYRKPILEWKDTGNRTQECASSAPSPLPDITISHSNGIAIAAVSLDGSLIGLDAEPLNISRSKNLLTMMASGEELQHLEKTWAKDELMGVQESNRTWVMKEAVQKACGLGMHISPQSFSVLNRDRVLVSHQHMEYHLEVFHWRELLDDRPFVFGFSRLNEDVNSNWNP